MADGAGVTGVTGVTAQRAALWTALRKAASRLGDVEERTMFGCEALFTNGAIFALVWKTGRIGVKLPDASRFDALASQRGSEPWRAGEMTMSHWLLVPKAMEGDAARLSAWVKEAHGLARAGARTDSSGEMAAPPMPGGTMS